MIYNARKLKSAIEHFKDSLSKHARVLVSACRELAWVVIDLSLGRTIYSETEKLVKVLTHPD